MSTNDYELRAWRGSKEVGGANPIIASLDLNQPAIYHGLLVRHLLAFVARDGAKVTEAHLYHLDVRAASGGRASGNVLFRVALPVDPAVVPEVIRRDLDR